MKNRNEAKTEHKTPSIITPMAVFAAMSPSPERPHMHMGQARITESKREFVFITE